MGKLTRRELYERVWQTPMRTLAKECKISDVGLKKICDRHSVPTPGLGYWAKVAHGKKVTQTKLPTKTGGEPDVIVIEPEQWHLKGAVWDEAEFAWTKIQEYAALRFFTSSNYEPHLIGCHALREEATEVAWPYMQARDFMRRAFNVHSYDDFTSVESRESDRWRAAKGHLIIAHYLADYLERLEASLKTEDVDFGFSLPDNYDQFHDANDWPANKRPIEL